MSTLYTLFGYGDVGGATMPRFLEQLTIALGGYALAALLTQLTPHQENFLHDVYCISFLGSGANYLLKLIIVDGQNGIPWVIDAVLREHSIRPIIHLFGSTFSYTILAFLISFPFVAATLWLGIIQGKKTTHRY